MGFNTTTVICNDVLDQIGRDPDYGHKIDQAVRRLPCERGKNGIHVYPGTMVIETHHASGLVPILSGANTGRIVQNVCVDWERAMDGRDPEEDLLRQLADAKGFRLVRKRK